MITKFSASSISGKLFYRSMLAGNSPFEPSFYELISTTTVSGTSSVVTLSSIDQTYKHLQIRASIGSSGGNQTLINFNGDSGNNYAFHSLEGNTSSVSAQASATFGYGLIYHGIGTGSFGGAVIDILDYANTTRNKTLRVFNGRYDDVGGQNRVALRSMLWVNTSNVSSITFTCSGANFAVGTRFSLYGIKG